VFLGLETFLVSLTASPGQAFRYCQVICSPQPPRSRACRHQHRRQHARLPARQLQHLHLRRYIEVFTQLSARSRKPRKRCGSRILSENIKASPRLLFKGGDPRRGAAETRKKEKGDPRECLPRRAGCPSGGLPVQLPVLPDPEAGAACRSARGPAKDSLAAEKGEIDEIQAFKGRNDHCLRH